MNTTTNAALSYSTSTEGEVSFDGLSTELQQELGLFAHEDIGFTDLSEDPYEMQDWCHVCLRATDHRGEHDDLVEQGLAAYDSVAPRVYQLG